MTGPGHSQRKGLEGALHHRELAEGPPDRQVWAGLGLLCRHMVIGKRSRPASPRPGRRTPQIPPSAVLSEWGTSGTNPGLRCWLVALLGHVTSPGMGAIGASGMSEPQDLGGCWDKGFLFQDPPRWQGQHPLSLPRAAAGRQGTSPSPLLPSALPALCWPPPASHSSVWTPPEAPD